MVTIVNTVTVQAMSIIPTEVQTSMFNGIPSFQIVGMAGKSVNEAAIRIKAALNSLGIEMPPKKIVVNLSPTNISKEGNYYDLPIIFSILCELKIIQNINLENFLIIGELSLDGRIKSVKIALITSLYAKMNNLNLICPHENGGIAALSDVKEIIHPKNLIELISHFKDNSELGYKIQNPIAPIIKLKDEYENDFSMIKGSSSIKRALEIASAGGHSLLIQGPPGLGKTFAAECIRSIMPDLTTKEIIEILLIQNTSDKNLGTNSCMIQNKTQIENIIEIERPFRCPHHSASMASIVGGGKMIEPGEITFAHNGILFLDELPEFSPCVLDSLREPIEKKEINITRAERNVTYPANFQLIAAMNPCKCGYFGNKEKECQRVPNCGLNYQKKISGPFLDRIDLFVYISQVENKEKNQSTEKINQENLLKFTKEKINHARKLQEKRFSDLDFQTNSSAKSTKNFIEICSLEENALKFIENLLDSEKINQRNFLKTISIARTIADLEKEEFVQKNHILESLFFKRNY